MSNFFPRAARLALPLAILAVYGCRCGPPQVTRNEPEFTVTPTALSFETCPQQDEAGKPVADVFPDQKTFTLSNLGSATGTVSLAFSGAQKDAFSVVEKDVPAELARNATAEIPIRFAPTRAGEASATLTVDDGSEETAPITVSLQGVGRSLPASAKLEVAYEDPGTKKFIACADGVGCNLEYPVAFYDQSVTLKVRLKNAGCPALKVTGVTITEHPQSPSRVDYYLDAPALPPTTATPTVLTTTGGNNELLLAVRFSPQRSTPGDDQRYAILTVKTNDPTNPEFPITLIGAGSDPAIYVTPGFCNFSEPLDTCGYATKTANKAKFLLKNSGSAAVKIDSALLEKGGQGRFSLVNDPKGQMLNPGAELPVEVSYTEAAPLVSERLVFSSSTPAGPAGDAVVVLRGGVPPVLSTDPADQLSFTGATTQVSTKTLTVQNAAGAGTLVLSKVSVDENPFFKLLTTVAAGTTVAPGASTTLEIQFTKPAQGGIQTSSLHIESNDPRFGAPNFKTVNLYSEAPLDQFPVAVLKGCAPADTACAAGKESVFTIKLSDLGGPPKKVLIWGNDSYDPITAGGTKKVAKFMFRLEGAPSNADASKLGLENDRMTTTTGNVFLTVDPGVAGEYRISLRVWDDVNQQSPSAALLRVIVQ